MQKKKRYDELERLTQSVYEDKVIGKIPEDVCLKLLTKYTEEQSALKSEIEELESGLSVVSKNEADVDEFIRRLKRYTDIPELTRELCLELIEYITIGASPDDKTGTREIHIYYKLLGLKLYCPFAQRSKIRCGYCGGPVSSGSGTSKSGRILRYYRCNTRYTKAGCEQMPIRKDLLEELVVNAVQEAFHKTDLEALADGILEQGKKIAEDSSVLNLLTTEYGETTRAIDNLLRAVEQGIFTQSTKDRLEQLEARKTELETKIACEKARALQMITKEQILEHLRAALKRSSKRLISYFVRKVVLFNDHIDVYCKSIENHDPDGNDSHREFSFYEVKMTVEIDRHTYGGEKEEQTYAIAL